MPTPSRDTTNAEVFRQAIRDGLSRARVPKRYVDVPPRIDLEPGEWAFITGGVGSGKTYAAVGFLRRYLQDGAISVGEGKLWITPRASFTTVAGYLEEVKRGFDGDSRAQTLRRSPFLVMDDLGQEVPTQWAVSQLFDLINHRYSEQLQTVITSQFSRGSIARRLSVNGGEEQALAIASRLAEECRVIDLGSTDRRINERG